MAEPALATESTELQAVIRTMQEKQERDHEVVLERLEQMQANLLTKADETTSILPKLQNIPSFMMSPTWPAVLAGFCDYMGLAMITPALPHHLEEFFATPAAGILNQTLLNEHLLDNCTLSGDPPLCPLQRGIINKQVTTWTTLITGMQFLAICLSNVFWTLFGDRVPHKLAVQITVLGSGICFGVSSFLEDPVPLAAARIVTGLCSPLVPAIVFLLGRAQTMTQVIDGIANFTLGALLAYSAANAIVGFAFRYVQWKGINLIAFGAMMFACFVVTCYSSPPANPNLTPRPLRPFLPLLQPGASKALLSPWFMVHGATAFATGWLQGSTPNLNVLLLQQSWHLSTETTAEIFIAIPLVLFFQNRLTKWATVCRTPVTSAHPQTLLV